MPPTYFCLLPCYWYSTTQATRNRAGDIGLEELFRGPGGLGERVPPPGRISMSWFGTLVVVVVVVVLVLVLVVAAAAAAVVVVVVAVVVVVRNKAHGRGFQWGFKGSRGFGERVPPPCPRRISACYSATSTVLLRRGLPRASDASPSPGAMSRGVFFESLGNLGKFQPNPPPRRAEDWPRMPRARRDVRSLHRPIC